MRWLVSTAVGLAAALMWTMNAEADSPWYLEGSLGGYVRDSFSSPVTFRHTPGPSVTAPGVNTFKVNPGLIANVGLGYRVAPHVRLEAEVGYTTYTGDTLNPYTTAPGFPALNGQTFTRQSGDRWSRYSGTVNAFYDFIPIAGRFTPYVGGGVGAAAGHRTKGVYKDAAGQPFGSGGGSSTQGFGLLEGGVAIALSPHWALVPAYRYVHFFTEGQDVAHVGKVGLRYAF